MFVHLCVCVRLSVRMWMCVHVFIIIIFFYFFSHGVLAGFKTLNIRKIKILWCPLTLREWNSVTPLNNNWYALVVESSLSRVPFLRCSHVTTSLLRLAAWESAIFACAINAGATGWPYAITWRFLRHLKYCFVWTLDTILLSF